MNEERDKQVIQYVRTVLEYSRNILDLMENGEAQSKSESEKVLPEGYYDRFDDIMLEDKKFGLADVDVVRIFPEKSGTTHGTTWTRKSVIIKDRFGEERELIAWGDNIRIFDKLHIGDKISVSTVDKVSTYKLKTGAEVIQFTVGNDTYIDILNTGDEHIL
ncbi:MAG: hypothetical protein ACTSPB_09965 [Candidatus Thorarchaeota archaeon]